MPAGIGRGPFSAPLSATSITTRVDLFHVTAGTDNPVTMCQVELYNTTDLSDTNEEVL